MDTLQILKVILLTIVEKINFPWMERYDIFSIKCQTFIDCRPQKNTRSKLLIFK